MKQFTLFLQFGLILLQSAFITCEDDGNILILLLPPAAPSEAKSPSPSSSSDAKENVLILLLPPSSSPALRLQDGLSLRHKLETYSGISTPVVGEVKVQSKDEMCQDAVSHATKLTQSVISAVNYYEAHVSQLETLDATAGLQVLRGALYHIYKQRGQDLYMSLLNRTQPIVNQIIDQAYKGTKSDVYNEAITAIGKEGKDLFSRCQLKDWKSEQVLLQKTVASVGNDPEVVWPPLNLQCQAALVSRCDVPYTCQRTFLDTEPQSQYMLTHQALYLLFAKKKSCHMKHPELFSEWEQSLETQCGKMLQEAELLAANGFPDWGRDLFSEYVFICGLVGYPNFLRTDWIQEIQSWQSKSDFGCFVNSDDTKYTSTEIRFVRKPTAEEQRQNVEPQEKCSTHFSSTSLAALAMKLEWLHDKCLPEGEEYEVMMKTFEEVV